MNVGIIIPCYNRPEYLKRCLESVAASELPFVKKIVAVNDASTDPEVHYTLLPYTKIVLHFIVRGHYINKGIKQVLLENIDSLFNEGFDIIVTLDSDAIVKPHWLQTLLWLKQQHPERIVSGFNSMNTNKDGSLRNPIIREGRDYLLKKHCNGINMCMNKYDYETHIRPALQKPGNWDFNSTNKNGFIISKPSVVQHIGLVSSMGHNDNPDVAYDF